MHISPCCDTLISLYVAMDPGKPNDKEKNVTASVQEGLSKFETGGKTGRLKTTVKLVMKAALKH